MKILNSRRFNNWPLPYLIVLINSALALVYLLAGQQDKTTVTEGK